MSSTEKDSAYSLSDFLKDFPNKLFSEPSVEGELYVFSGRDDDDDELEPSKTLSNQRPTKAAMKAFLKELKVYFFSPLLVQFWMAKSKGGNRVLTTSDQPFGLDFFHKGLASYRSHCVDNNYVISDNEDAEDIGPHVRVFRDKCLELSPDVRNHSVKDYPQRQYTIFCGVRGLLALPVFRGMRGPCIGVLEIVTTSNEAIEFDDVLNVCNGLEEAGLVCPNPYFNYAVEMFEGTTDAFKEISKALDKVCKALNIPFAQTWMPCSHSMSWAYGSSSERKSYTPFDGGESGHVKLTTVKAPYSMTVQNLHFFRQTAELYYIQKGKGVVGRAFSSNNACFCKDVSKLSIIEYPLAHYAFAFDHLDLNSSFAISVRSSYTGNIVYILEFFLPCVKIDGEDPPIFLESLLGKMKQHFHSFRVASGEELGGKLSIEVIKLPVEDELNSFETCQTTRSPPRLEALRDGEETMQLDSPYQQLTVEFSTNSGRNVVGAEQRNSTSYRPMLEACQNVGKIVQPDSSYHKAMTEVDSTNSGRNVVSAEQRDSSYQKNMAEVDATNNDKKFASADQSDIADIPLEKRGPAEGSDREGEISREVLEKQFGMDVENAARNLGVSRSTFKRKCRLHGIKRWPFPKRNRVTRSPSQLESIVVRLLSKPQIMLLPQCHMFQQSKTRALWP